MTRRRAAIALGLVAAAGAAFLWLLAWIQRGVDERPHVYLADEIARRGT